jgi:hypothetical protein
MRSETANKGCLNTYTELKTTTYHNWHSDISPMEIGMTATQKEDGENII